ncbi:MAG: dicarboxylate/amino acid:cation symporter [Spirochaetota bacterium]
MKLWMRILIGAAIGLILGLYLPTEGGDTVEVMETLAALVVNVGRYAVFPLIFFGLVIGLHELREDRMTLRVFGKAALSIVTVTAVMVIITTLVTLLLAPRRIPPIFQEAVVPEIPSVAALLANVFPRNLFSVFAVPGNYLLPVAAAAVLVGLVLHHEGATVGPAVDVADSLARVFYRLNSWIVDAVSVGLIAVSSYWVLQLRTVSDLDLFAPLVWVLMGLASLFVLVGFPLVVFFWGARYNPFSWLYAMVVPAVVAFFSGDSYFTLGPLTRIAKENFGVSREAASPTLSMATLFGKSGSAMVIAAAFITVFRSYTALEITFAQVLWIMVAAFLFSFLLGRVPGSTVIVGLSLLAQSYGEGMEDIYLILLPALPILTGIAVVVDTMTAAAITFMVGHWERKRRIVDPLDFV